ncbi:MAG: DEAD/DEAH box helicase, partial [Actinomycetales bacterium]|nr:DEAD/DEAH box helicase [Actinomycetales bacterium]
VVQPPATKEIVVDVEVPVPDLTELAVVPGNQQRPAGEGGRAPVPSIWPHVDERIVDLVAEHRSTLVFANARRGAERLAARMNEVWATRHGAELPARGEAWAARVPGQSGTAVSVTEDVIALAHHGSMSRAQRTLVEERLKAGELPAVVATSSLELGIDIGALDLVVQVGAPPSVASGLQRAGRAGHQVGAVSRTVMFPTHRGDLVACAVAARRMRRGELESQPEISNPLDVLAQQVVAMLALDELTVAQLAAVVRRAAPFAQLSDALLASVLDMLAGRYPNEIGELGQSALRPRIVWDRRTDTLTGRPGAQRLAVTSGGTIPDRGLFSVVVVGDDRGGRRVGELDEEMVYESRAGDTITLGSSTWRIEEITGEQVVVSPAPGQPGRLPFWKGDTPGRPAELGRALGAWVREVDAAARRSDDGALAELFSGSGLDAWARDNVLDYVGSQRQATGRVPDDRTLVVESFRDELGDWRVVIHSPYGARVHAPWSLVLAARLRERTGVDVAAAVADDGIVLRLPDADGVLGTAAGAGAGSPLPFDLDTLVLDPGEVTAAVSALVAGSAQFAARFREAAARALLLPRRRPDRRQPLWQQRLRASQLLDATHELHDFPILLEATRECLQDDFDLDALRELMADVAARRVEVVEVATTRPSPFARSLLQAYTAVFLYDGDQPLAERRAAALTLDTELLAELLGDDAGALADLLDPDVVRQVEDELARRTPERAVRDLEGLADLLRTHGPLALADASAAVREESRGDVAGWLAELAKTGRALCVEVPGLPSAGSALAGADDGGAPGTTSSALWLAVEDAGLVRDALGVTLPSGVPEVFLEPARDPLSTLVARFARHHGPFGVADVRARLGLAPAVAAATLERLVTAGTLVTGRLRPDELRTLPASQDFCDAQVLRLVRRRSLAALRAEVEPVDSAALGRFLPAWQGVGRLRGVEGTLEAVSILAGLPLPAGSLESLILPARVVDYSPAMLDELVASGEVTWRGHGALPGQDGLVSLVPAGEPDLLRAPRASVSPPEDEGRGAVEDADGEASAAREAELDALVLGALAEGGAAFLPALLARTGLEGAAPDVVAALWRAVWRGQVTNDSLTPLRAWLAGSTTPTRPQPTARPRPLGRYARPTGAAHRPVGAGAGRWSLVEDARAVDAPSQDVQAEDTRTAHALAQRLLARHGVLTRSVLPSEGLAGRFGPLYRVLSGMEIAGQVLRGYFVEHLGGAQFALTEAVEALRATPAHGTEACRAVVLAASDPANPYGAALAWPASTDPDATQRPGRKAGAVVVLVGGELALFVERGGRTLLTFTHDATALDAAAEALAATVRAGRLGTFTVRRGDGAPMTAREQRTGPLGGALVRAGFVPTPQGLRLRA